MNLLKALFQGLLQTKDEFTPGEFGLVDYQKHFIPMFQTYMNAMRKHGTETLFTSIPLDNGCTAYKYDFICDGCSEHHLLGFVFGDEDGTDLGVLMPVSEIEDFEMFMHGDEGSCPDCSEDL